jgi:hypothetical protein
MDFKQRFLAALKKPETVVNDSKQQFGSIDYTIPNIPCVITKKKDDFVWYGEDNLYPLKVSDLRNGSGIHNSIIKLKTKMTAGDGWLINGAKNEVESTNNYNALDSGTKAAYDFFLKNPNNFESIEKIKAKLAEDLQEQGQFAYEIIFNNDFTKITTIKYVKVENIRSGKLVDDHVESYYYANDWSQRGVKPKEIKAFNPKDPKSVGSYNQLVFEKLGTNDYYGDLPYKGCLTWIQTDFKMGLFHLANIDNGMNPGMHFKFYKLPKSESDKQDILNSLKRTYMGALNANRFAATFSEGKELAPDIMPIQTSNLDKQLLLLAELCDKKILTGHQLTSPLLAGVSVSGQLGGNSELKTSAVLFDNLSLKSDRNMISESFQKILEYNKVNIEIDINGFDPLKTNITV